MNKKVLIALLLIPGMAQAVICKSVDAEGVVAYTDVPAAECEKPVRLPPSSTYGPRELPAATFPSTNPVEAVKGKTVKPFVRYESIKIVQPAANGTVRSNEGNVTVVVELQPTLQSGHRIKIFIDGGAVPGEFDGAVVDLRGVNRGTHSLRAVVSDAQGKRLGDSPSIRFTMRRTGLFDNARPEAPVNPPEVPPGFPAPGDKPDFGPGADPDFGPGADPDFNPGAAPDYGPGSPPPAATPGQTNPAFKPNYGR